MKSVRMALAALAAFAVLIVLVTWPFVGQRLVDAAKITPTDGGCDTTPSGPSALVAFDRGSGDLIWQRTVGGPWPEAARDGETVRVHSASYERVIDLATGDLVTCTDIGPIPQLDQPAAGPIPTVEPARPDIAAGDHVLEVIDLPWASDAQKIGLQMTSRETGAVLWGQDVPGYRGWVTHHTSGALVLVTDQTGGTGIVAFGDPLLAKLTAYEAATGAQRWQVDLAHLGGTAVEVGATRSAVATQTRVTLLDTATGDTVWAADHGSPGQSNFFGAYREPGGYERFWVEPESNLLIGLIHAEKPYRD